jgi:hypothetical protein
MVESWILDDLVGYWRSGPTFPNLSKSSLRFCLSFRPLTACANARPTGNQAMTILFSSIRTVLWPNLNIDHAVRNVQMQNAQSLVTCVPQFSRNLLGARAGMAVFQKLSGCRQRSRTAQRDPGRQAKSFNRAVLPLSRAVSHSACEKV